MFYYFALLLPFFSCLFWAVTLLCHWRTNYRAQNIWIVVMSIIAVSSYVWATFFEGTVNGSTYYKLDTIETFSTALLHPLLFFYFKLLTDEHPFGWKEYIWLLPAFFIGTGTMLLYITMGEENASAYAQGLLDNGGKLVSHTEPVHRLHYFISVRLYNLTVLIQAVGVTVWAFFQLIRYKRRLRNFFSNLEGKSLNNYQAVLAGICILLVFSLIGVARGRFYYSQYPMEVAVLFFVFASVIYYLGYTVANLNYTAETLANELEKADKEAKAWSIELPDEKAIEEEGLKEYIKEDPDIRQKIPPQLFHSFTHLVENEKIFLQKNLRIDDLVKLTHSNRTYISRLINEQYNCNFSDFINNQRVIYAQELIRQNRHMSQEQIAELSGFQTTSSFSRTFKQHAGINFRDFQKELQNDL